MIWFRRILTIPLIIIFVALLIVLLPVSQLNDTVGNPEFYKDHIQQADLYNFVYDEVLPAGLDELETEPAYKRKNVDLSDAVPSKDSEVSKYTLSDGDDDGSELKSDNSFLHDNVD